MFKVLYYSNKINKNICNNKIRNLININNFYINVIRIANIIKDKYISKILYYLCLIILSVEYDKTTSLSLFIMLSIIGSLNNTYMFKSEEKTKIIINNYKTNTRFLLYNFYFELIKYTIETIPFIIVYSYFLELSLLKIIEIILFIFNIKVVTNSLYFITRKVYNEDSPDIKSYISNIIILLISILIVWKKINVIEIINITNLISIISNIYLIKKDYNELSNHLYEYNDFNIKEQIKLKESKIKPEKENYKYLNKIFNKRYKKYIILNLVRSIIFFVMLSTIYTKPKFIISEIITYCFFTNISYKMIELYYYKCDKSLAKYIDIKIMGCRLKTLLKYNLFLSVFIMIKYLKIKYVVYILFLTYIFSKLFITLYYLIKPFTTKKRTIIYYGIYILLTSNIILLDLININIITAYITGIITMLVLNIISNKYICKVSFDLYDKKVKYSKIK